MNEDAYEIAKASVEKIRKNVKCTVSFAADSKEKEHHDIQSGYLQNFAKSIRVTDNLMGTRYYLFPTFFGIGECGAMANLACLMLIYSGKIKGENIHFIACGSTEEETHTFCHIGTLKKPLTENIPCHNTKKLKAYFEKYFSEGYIVDPYLNFVGRAKDLSTEFLHFFKIHKLGTRFLKIEKSAQGVTPEHALSLYNRAMATAKKHAAEITKNTSCNFHPTTLDIVEASLENKEKPSRTYANVIKSTTPTDKKSSPTSTHPSESINKTDKKKTTLTLETERQAIVRASTEATNAFKKGNFQQALQLDREAADYWEKQSNAKAQQASQFNLGLTLLHLEEYDEALVALQKAYNLQDPNHRAGTQFETKLNLCKELMKADTFLSPRSPGLCKIL